MTMSPTHSQATIARKPLRLWPGVVLVVLQWLLRFAVPAVVPEAMPVGMMAGAFGGVAILVWWLFFSRAPWPERLGATALVLAAVLVTARLVDDSIATAAQGMLYPILAIPIVSLAFVAWAALGRGLAPGGRFAALAAILALVCVGLASIQTYGVSGGLRWDFAWRWATTPEERLLARADNAPVGETVAAVPVDRPADWPGFRGRGRDGTVRAARIDTDWTTSPPVELWRRAVGPGWSSFAVAGDFFYTQEQRGEQEVVACYRTSSGEPVWQHEDPVRFWEAMAGAGPRGTPTLHGGRVYALGATGILNVLDATDGTVVWSRDAAADTETAVPGWGFSSSPLVVDDLVIVATAGQLIAYDLATGEPSWLGPEGEESYSSPHLLTFDGMPQVLLLTGAGVIGVAPEDGSLLWEHPWPGFHSLQPALTADGDLLITSSGSSGGVGTRRLTVAREADGWSVEEQWTSNGLKPYFNDFVVHEGRAFGFDGRILAAIDLADGERVWKGGRYGNGQLVLLADQEVLLVLSEKGELALVDAAPDRFTELARFPAIEGKTWNHPVLVGDLVLVRNDREMAAFRLPRASS
jgi:outer membrane protein assembly factor BamB